MPGETFKRAVDRMLSGRMGTTVTLTQFSDDGTVDEYGDPSKTVDTTTANVPALLRKPSRVRERETEPPIGIDSSVDVLVWVPDDYTVTEPGTDNRYGTRITHDPTSREYDVLETWDNDNGQILATAKEV